MHQMILKAMHNLGYDKGWVLSGDTYEGIEWVEQPETIPTEEEVLDMVNQLEVLEQEEQDAIILHPAPGEKLTINNNTD